MIGPKKYIRTVKTIGDKGTKVEHLVPVLVQNC